LFELPPSLVGGAWREGWFSEDLGELNWAKLACRAARDAVPNCPSWVLLTVFPCVGVVKLFGWP